MLLMFSRRRLWAGALALSALRVGWAQQPSNLISIIPCRAVDTRNAAGPFGGPYMSAGSTRSFPIPSSSCGLPPNASAYSLNVAVVPRGPLGYVTLWPTGQSQPTVATLNDSAGLILNNGSIVPAGTNGAINVFVTNDTDVILDINGYFLSQSDSSTESTALGTGANASGTQNTAVGFNALEVNGSGNGNTATGSLALSSNTSGNNNAAFGTGALGLNASGSANTAMGGQALFNDLIGSGNTAVGFSALWSNTTGTNNTAVGVNALSAAATASGNIALGYEAGNQITIGTNNVDIGNPGAATDSNAIRIGVEGVQVTAYMAGINGATVSGPMVLVDPNTGQLGIASSSARYKKDIQDMGDASSALMQLRPVVFRYKESAAPGNAALQYGLIGEEVEKVYPELVVHGRDGQVEAVQYQELPALLLNELQKQHEQIEVLEKRVSELNARLRAR